MYDQQLLTWFRNILLASAFPLASLALTPATAQAALFVFGDSLSDTGNTAQVTAGQIPPLVLPAIDPATNSLTLVEAYSKGRFANDSIWIDFLADDLGVTNDFFSFAFSGATTGTLNTAASVLPGLQQQIDAFLIAGLATTPDDLYILWAGNNDYLEISGQTDPSIPVNNIQRAILKLATAGAKNFLIPNLPDLGITPLVKDRQNASQVSALVKSHNALLADTLATLEQNPAFALNLLSLDIFSLINDAADNPGNFGFTNTQTACLFPSPLFFTPGLVSKCSNPDEYLFWDSLHPSSRAHRFVATAALETLEDANHPHASVPEPDPLVALGLLSSGFMLVRRWLKKQAVPIS